ANGFLLTAGMPVGKAQVHDGDIQLSVTASGLGTGCEGHKLCGVVRVRVTTHRCPMSPCTTTDLELTNLSDTACCTVTNGNCKLNTRLNTGVFDALRLGQRAGIELLGCGLRRRDAPTPPTGLTFACGMLALSPERCDGARRRAVFHPPGERPQLVGSRDASIVGVLSPDQFSR